MSTPILHVVFYEWFTILEFVSEKDESNPSSHASATLTSPVAAEEWDIAIFAFLDFRWNEIAAASQFQKKINYYKIVGATTVSPPRPAPPRRRNTLAAQGHLTPRGGKWHVVKNSKIAQNEDIQEPSAASIFSAAVTVLENGKSGTHWWISQHAMGGWM